MNNKFYLDDLPIKNYKYDLLRREIFVKEIVDTLLSCNCHDNSFVASLNGEWGSGKTSIINLVKNEISKLNVDNKIKTIDFSPWNIISQEAIIKQFFTSFEGKTSLVRKEKVSKFFQLVFYIFLLMADIKSNHQLNRLLGQYENIVLKKQKRNLTAVKDKIKKFLIKNNRKYIIFIDDLDRLNNEEIHLVVQLIKSICDFPNVVYLVSFDKKIVESAFDSEQPTVKGNKYIEKIIQFPFNIPELTLRQKIEFLLYSIYKLMPEFKDNKEWQKRFIDFFHNGLKDYFDNIRSIKRYINTLHFAIKLYKDKINVIDLMVIEAVKLYDNELFELIVTNKELLCGERSYGSREDAKNAIQAVEKATSKFGIIRHLFPHVTYVKNNSYMSGKTASRYEADGRLCCIKHFEYYLSLRVDEDLLFRDDVLKSFTTNSSDNNVYLFENMSEENYTSYLSYLSGFAQNIDNIDLISNFLPQLFEADRKMIDKFGAGNVRNYTYINCVLEEIYIAKNAETFVKYLIDLLTNSTNFYTLIHILYIVGSNTKFYGNGRDPNIYNRITKEDLSKMNEILSLKIKNSLIKSENRPNNDEFCEMMRFLVLGKKEDYIKDFYSTLNKEKLISVMNNLILEGWISKSIGDSYESEKTYGFMHFCFDKLITDRQKNELTDYYEQLKQTDEIIDFNKYFGLILYNIPIKNNESDYHTRKDIFNFAKNNGIKLK